MTLTPHWRTRALHKHVQVMYAQGRLLYVHTPKVLGCTPPAIIRHFSFRSAPCHDIRQFTGHMRTKSHIGVYPLSTLPMPNTTATQWCPIGIVIHGYRRCKSRAVRPFAAVSPTSSLFIIAIVGGLIILGVLPRCLYHIIGLGGTSLGVWLGRLGLGGLGRGAEGRSEGSGRLIERSFPTCTARLENPHYFTVHASPLLVPSRSRTIPLCTGVDFHEVSSSLDHPSGLMSCDVHQHVTPWASYFCEGIAQRVGMGLRPGKLRKKALSEDNKDGELARGIDQGILMPEWLKLMSVGLAS